ncbi:succinyl-diaminopimelate desuccinylase [Methanomicrobium sp. W14]|uniref:M20/M25/M40 family metallo-hydrolase n=1 Tax=Methanomicrobium sp. W14 TaxID=2817839 RepID=UPI001AE22351|nr:M20/M25/M40 family metallo-hydrolase [Methanomicrobium sp. W14]MBP2132551.1 succinyl-diaminopimelate desuccinylase [Methanomicrobium sp. W14]
MNVSEICSDLVKIRSENPPGKTAEVADYIGDFLEKKGLKYKSTDDGAGRCNIYTDYKKRPLLFSGHLDVVPAIDEGWNKKPFSGEISGGFVYGRGSTDMKGGCASILYSISKTIEDGFDLPCNLCFVCDEENGGKAGIQFLLAKKIIHPCDCIIAEPTPHLNPAIGQKGLLRMKINFTGVPGHGSLYPAVGVSAIMNASKFLDSVKRLYCKTFSCSPDIEEIIARSSRVLSKLFGISNAEEVLKKVTYNPGKITGGEEMNITAQKCTLELETRIPWGCSTGYVKNELYKSCQSFEIKVHEESDPNITHPDSKLVKTVCREVERVYESKPCPIVQWAASDARYLRKSGFNVLEYGPGDIKTIHGINEKVSADDLFKATEIYSGVLKSYMQVKL